jgi:hypothetical protein
MPSGVHFRPYFRLLILDIGKTEVFAFFKVGRYPTICLSIGGIEAVYSLPQPLVISNYDLQSSTRDAPFSECLTSFRECSNGAIIGERRSSSALKEIVYTLMGAQYSNTSSHTRNHCLHPTISPLVRNRQQVGQNGADKDAKQTKESSGHGPFLPFIFPSGAPFTSNT